MPSAVSQPVYADLERLGPVVFRQRQDNYLVAEICIIIFTFVGAVALVIYSLTSPFKDEIYIALIGLSVPLVLTAIALNRRLRVFQCHENGVSLRTWHGDRGLLFEEIVTFQFDAFHYIFLFPTGTALRLRFSPAPRSGLKSLAFIGNFATQSAGMESLRKRVSEFVARRIALKLSEDLSAPWTRMLTLEEKGVCWRALVWTPIIRPRLVPYEEIGEMKIADGVFYLFRHGTIWPAITMPVGEVNFFPGLNVLDKILQEKRKGQEFNGAFGDPDVSGK